jgi:hypothetical protein
MAVRRLLRHTDLGTGWTNADSRNLTVFLTGTATGKKLKACVDTHIINSSQNVVASGGSPFECGTITGMRMLWVFIETITLAQVTPEDDNI